MLEQILVFALVLGAVVYLGSLCLAKRRKSGCGDCCSKGDKK